MNKTRLLLIEDDEILGASLLQRLSLEGFVVEWTRTAREATEALEKRQYDAIVSDIRLPDGDGETVMRSQFDAMGLVPIIFMTAYGEIDQAVRLVQDGAWDYLSKPFDIDALIDRLKPLTEGGIAPSGDRHVLGTSAAMRPITSMLDKAAPLDLPVTLMGETGTGKEVAARYLHEQGPHKRHPFVAVNAGMLQAEMADSLLFGHERGAFTGATSAHTGFVEEAGEGTLFLDEIGELSHPMQVKLLRLLEQRTFRRLGGVKDVAFTARVICATNRDLEAMVAEGTFRQDLWYRINVITAVLPPLRNRQDDIAPLLRQRMRTAADRFDRAVPELSPEALAAAHAYRWPGNVRELCNRIDRAVAMNDSGTISESELFPDIRTPAAVGASDTDAMTLTQAREAAERAHIAAALERSDGKIQAAADQLGVSRTTLWDKINRLNIKPGK